MKFDVAGIERCQLTMQRWTLRDFRHCPQPTQGLRLDLRLKVNKRLSETNDRIASVSKTGYETGYGIDKSSGVPWFHGRLGVDFLFNVSAVIQNLHSAYTATKKQKPNHED
jgi:hypothetical protein